MPDGLAFPVVDFEDIIKYHVLESFPSSQKARYAIIGKSPWIFEIITKESTTRYILFDEEVSALLAEINGNSHHEDCSNCLRNNSSNALAMIINQAEATA